MILLKCTEVFQLYLPYKNVTENVLLNVGSANSQNKYSGLRREDLTKLFVHADFSAKY
jgi:hypothetical protein